MRVSSASFLSDYDIQIIVHVKKCFTEGLLVPAKSSSKLLISIEKCIREVF